MEPSHKLESAAVPTEPSGDTKRGVFIVLEGADRVGKTSARSIVEKMMHDKGEACVTMGFPDRATETGREIDRFLRKEKRFSPMDIHKLYGNNRTEKMEFMKSLLLMGTNILCDRYVYSGCAYTMSNILSTEGHIGPKADVEKRCDAIMKDLCMVDINQIIPDVVVHLSSGGDGEEEREGFGDEIYETKTFVGLLKHLGYPQTYKFYEDAHHERGTKIIELVNKTDEELVSFNGEAKPRALVQTCERIVEIFHDTKELMDQGALAGLKRYSDYIEVHHSD